MHSFSKVAIGTLFGICSMSVNASLYSQSPLENGDGILSELDQGAQVADNFQVSQNSDLTGIRWWGSYDTSPAGISENFVVNIFSDDAGAPGTALATFDFNSLAGTRTDTLKTDLFGSSIYEYFIDISTAAKSLMATTTYYLSVVHDDQVGDPNSLLNWYWLESAAGDNWTRPIGSQTWTNNNNITVAFELAGNPTPKGSVPAPATLLLMLAPLGLLAMRKRKNK